MSLHSTRNAEQQTLAKHSAPSPRTTAIIPSARDLQIVDSSFSVVGGDVIHNHNHHYHYERTRDIWAILQSIPNFRHIHHDMLSKATSGTGMWLVKGDKFRLWLEPNGDIKIFWGSGIPGAGKTLLASIVIEYLETLCKGSDAAICVCYVYFRYSDRSEMTVRNVLEIIVKQTLERHPECFELIHQSYAQHIREGSEPTEAQLLGLLQQLAERMTCTFYVLDALDEAPTKIQLVIVKTLASLTVKLFITSRPLKAVEANFPEAQTFAIIAQENDIDLHIAKRLDESADLQNLIRQAGPLLRDEIVSTIKKNCGGMFLHAALQLDAVCDCVSTQEVMDTLQAFPSSIEDVYHRTWARISNQSRNHALLAKVVLVWVLYASRPMTVEELMRAVATSPVTHKFEAARLVPGTTLISLCRGFVTVEEKNGIVRLVHYTAKGTLETLLHESFPHPHSLLAAVCMTHLSECGFQNTTINSAEELTTALKNDPLAAFASEAWALHARAGLDLEDTQRRAAQFVSESHAFPAFTESTRRYWGFDILAPLHMVALEHLPLVVLENPVFDKPNVASRIHQYSPLIMASWFGHEDLAARLLSLSEIHVNQVDNKGWTALMQAAKEGWEGIVGLLLAHPETQVNLASKYGATALNLAAYWGHGGVVKLLLAQPGIQVNLLNVDEFSALMQAANRGYEGIVKLLLEHHKIQVNLTGQSGWSALMRAASEGHEGVVKILLAVPGIQVNLAGYDGSTAFTLASCYGHASIAKLLLHGPDDIDVNALDNDGDTAIKMAAQNGHEATVRMLLGIPNIDITIRSTADGHTALSAAQANGHSGVVAILQEFEARTSSLPEIDQLASHDNSGEDTDSESSVSYYDAEETLEDDVL